MMTEHISISDLDRYLVGELTPSELSAFDTHIATCDQCRSMVKDHSGLKGSASILEHALSAKWPGHLTYDELEGVVDNTLTGNALLRVQKHLGACAECLGEVEHLKEFARPSAAESPAAAAQAMDWIGQLTGAFSTRRWALVFAFCVLAVFAGSIWFLTQGGESTDPLPTVEVAQNESTNATVPDDQPPANAEIAADASPEPILTVSLKDGGTAVGIDAAGTLIGYDGLSAPQADLLRSALRNGTVTVGSEVKELAPASERRMGDGSPAKADGFRVVSPIGKVLDTSRPTFMWKPLDGAESYRVDVFDINYQKFASSGDLRTTQWTAELPRGKTFIWQVTGIKDGTEVRSTAATASEARFRTLDLTRSRDLASIKRRYPRSHLLLALAYAEAGMIAEARMEIEILQRENRRSTLPKKLLTQLERSLIK